MIVSTLMDQQQFPIKQHLILRTPASLVSIVDREEVERQSLAWEAWGRGFFFPSRSGKRRVKNPSYDAILVLLLFLANSSLISLFFSKLIVVWNFLSQLNISTFNGRFTYRNYHEMIIIFLAFLFFSFSFWHSCFIIILCCLCLLFPILACVWTMWLWENWVKVTVEF